MNLSTCLCSTMKKMPINPEDSEVDPRVKKAHCSDWTPPHREMQPTGFAAPHLREDWSAAPAIPIKDVYQLAGELTEMRERISQQLIEIQQRLSQFKKPCSRSTRPTRKNADQGVLALLPGELSPISDAIESSKEIFSRPPDPSDELVYSQETWQRAIKLLIAHALSIWEKAKIAIRPPVISAGPDGSVDLYWTAASYGLLLNVPTDPHQAPTYYGDDTANPESNRISGKLDPTKPTDIGVLMWLAHTAEQ